MQSYDEALNNLLGTASCIGEVEQVLVEGALQRVLAQDVYAPICVPPFNNSAMDGIAFAFADVDASKPIELTQTVFAGHQPKPLVSGSACRIFTGAALPQHADTVVIQENCCFEIEGAVQIIGGNLSQGQNVRRVGEDIAKGELILSQGVRLSSAHIGLLASLGLKHVDVYKPLSVAVISTGDELKMAGEALLPGQIYNSNGPMLCAALAEKGLKAELFHIEDDLAKTQQVFQRAADDFDVLISVGGVSVGDADYVKQAIESLGSMEFWKVAMKPGKPLAFGRLGSKALLGLPGNPVSAFASYQLFAWPFLAKCQGEQVVPVPVQLLPIDLNAPMNPKRETFLRVSRVEENGALRLIPYPSQGSGILSSVVFSEGFARIPMGQKTQAGDRVNFIPFH